MLNFDNSLNHIHILSLILVHVILVLIKYIINLFPHQVLFAIYFNYKQNKKVRIVDVRDIIRTICARAKGGRCPGC